MSMVKGACPANNANEASNNHLETNALMGRLELVVCWPTGKLEGFTFPTAKEKVPLVWCPSVAETAFHVTV